MRKKKLQREINQQPINGLRVPSFIQCFESFKNATNYFDQIFHWSEKQWDEASAQASPSGPDVVININWSVFEYFEKRYKNEMHYYYYYYY